MKPLHCMLQEMEVDAWPATGLGIKAYVSAVYTWVFIVAASIMM